MQDVVPPAYLDQLSLLQDRIAPFSTELAFNIIEKDLGKPLDTVFSEISPEPVAAASLGQVRLFTILNGIDTTRSSTLCRLGSKAQLHLKLLSF